MASRGNSLWQRIGRTASRIVQAVLPEHCKAGGAAPSASSQGDAESEGEPIHATAATRRRLLHTLGALPVLGAAGGLAAATVRGAEPKEGASPGGAARPAFANPLDQQEFARLRSLDLSSPEVVAQQQRMPTGRIGNLSISRLICGSNLISPNTHARDLIYMNNLASRYNSEERVFMTLKRCEELGVNAAVLKDHNFRHIRLADYWKHWGGRMLWIADVITQDINQYERRLVQHLELGASAVYLWGGASDIWFHHQQQENIVRAFEIMKKYGVPVGIGAHRLEPIMFCEQEGLRPDFYILTLHHDRYWSAHPRENRRFLEMYQPVSEDHNEYHDNLFCDDAEQRIAFMQQVKVPWIAFKVLAAGAIDPRDGFSYAFAGGADFLCVGMFDFQVQEDAELVIETVARAANRPRPWA